MKRLSKDLDLDVAQKEKVEKVVERMFLDLREHFRKARPEADRIVDGAFSEIKGVLSEEQKKKLDEVRERFRTHRGRGFR